MQRYLMKPLPAQIPQALAARLQQLQTATIGHFCDWGFMDGGVQRLHPGPAVAGTAVTLSLPGRDSTLLHHVLGLLRPGDFLVIERQGDLRHACWGGGVTRAAINAGVAGAVIDGACTDPHEIRDLGFALWSRGVSALTTRLADFGGRFNVPVSCGGVAVCPGDALLADENGVLVVPVEEAEAVVARAEALGLEIARGEARLDRRELLGEVYGASAMVSR